MSSGGKPLFLTCSIPSFKVLLEASKFFGKSQARTQNSDIELRPPAYNNSRREACPRCCQIPDLFHSFFQSSLEASKFFGKSQARTYNSDIELRPPAEN